MQVVGHGKQEASDMHMIIQLEFKFPNDPNVYKVGKICQSFISKKTDKIHFAKYLILFCFSNHHDLKFKHKNYLHVQVIDMMTLLSKVLQAL